MFLLEHEALEFINTIYRRYRPNAAQKNVNETVDFQILADMQAKKLKEKYAVIKEDCDSFDIMPFEEAEKQGKQIMLNTKIEMFISSFSGGKDSQVVLDLVSRVIPSNDFSVIYSDTGYEIPPSLEIYEQTKTLYQKQYPDLQFHLSKNHQDVLYYWDKFGPPSRTQRWCCGVMKTAPLYRFLKEINGKGKQPNVLSFDGTRAEESVNRSHYHRIGYETKHNNVISARPIFYWNLVEIFLYLFSNKLPINPAYRSGVNRVGCVICPYASERGDFLSKKLFPETIKPFLDKIEDYVVKVGEKNVENYIKNRLWKMRAGGNSIENKSHVNILQNNNDFKAIIYCPQENLFTWLKILGKINYTQCGKNFSGEINYKKQIFHFERNENDENSILLKINNITDEILFISHLRKVLNKTANCVHCEVCEVECPTGALSVVPMVTVNEKKCIHCFKCLNFNETGCKVTSSIKKTGDKKMVSQKTKISRYNVFGLRENWLSKFFDSPDTFFENDNHGLNKEKQLPRLKTWLRDAEILNIKDEQITALGKLLQNKYSKIPNIVWEIIWTNLSINSDLCIWFATQIDFGKRFQKSELDILMQDYFQGSAAVTLEIALRALINTFKESPLGKMGICTLYKESGKTSISRQPYNDISPVSVAYSLYRYAESKKRYALTVSELYDSKQTEGIYRQFGVSRERFETILRTLKEDKNRVLNADLNMGLDNINLREDLTSTDMLKLLL